jgi:hypothetical protein
MSLTKQLLDEINRASSLKSDFRFRGSDSPRYRNEIKQDQSNIASFGRIAPAAR